MRVLLKTIEITLENTVFRDRQEFITYVYLSTEHCYLRPMFWFIDPPSI